MSISRGDVINVAHHLDLHPNERQIRKIIKEYDHAADNDPSAAWYLIVEQQLYDELGNKKGELMTPYKHAESSVKRWGGKASDYIAIHDWFDETKQYTGDWTHRAMRHHAAGIQWAIVLFGNAITNSVGVTVPVKLISELHVMEDCGFIPTVQDWLKPLAGAPEDWMLKVQTKSKQKLEIN